MSAKSKIIGVLGGMGPRATAIFFQNLVELTPANRDWDHLRIVVDDNPHLPSRTRHFLYGEESPFPGMLDCCKKLERYPVDLIAIPCNSAAVFVPQIQRHLAVPVLNIVEATAGAVANKHPEAKTVAVLGGYVTYKRQSYRPFLKAHGIELVDHGSIIQDRVEKLIESLKLSRADESHCWQITELVNQVKTRLDVQVIVLACTEFGGLPLQTAGEISLIDSNLELARHAVRVALS